jgi:hypothetical protein
MKTITIGAVSIPLDSYVVGGTALLGIRESGKTYAAKGIAEQLLDYKIPIVVFDAIGVWRYLKVAGTAAGGRGFKVVVAGGKVADLPLTPASAPEIVRAAIHENIPLVIAPHGEALRRERGRPAQGHECRTRGHAGRRAATARGSSTGALALDPARRRAEDPRRPHRRPRGHYDPGSATGGHRLRAAVDRDLCAPAGGQGARREQPRRDSGERGSVLSRTGDLFAPKPRRPRRVLLAVVDAGLDEEDGAARVMHVHLECRRCGFDGGWRWISRAGLAAGVPCPTCNAAGNSAAPEAS